MIIHFFIKDIYRTLKVNELSYFEVSSFPPCLISPPPPKNILFFPWGASGTHFCRSHRRKQIRRNRGLPLVKMVPVSDCERQFSDIISNKMDCEKLLSNYNYLLENNKKDILEFKVKEIIDGASAKVIYVSYNLFFFSDQLLFLFMSSENILSWYYF